MHSFISMFHKVISHSIKTPSWQPHQKQQGTSRGTRIQTSSSGIRVHRPMRENDCFMAKYSKRTMSRFFGRPLLLSKYTVYGVLIVVAICLTYYMVSDDAISVLTTHAQGYLQPLKGEEQQELPKFVETENMKLITRAGVTPYEDDPSLWKQPVLPERLRNASQTDPELIEHIRDKWILPPSTREFVLPPIHNVLNYSRFLDRAFSDLQHGFYVESGSGDGLTHPGTLILERQREWLGILIESDLELFSKLLSSHRRSFRINTCLSHTDTPVLLHLVVTDVNITEHRLVQCLPLFSILAALGLPRVNLMSLDQEPGITLPVLSNLPYDAVNVSTILLRSSQNKQAELVGQADYVKHLLHEHGYHGVITPLIPDMVMVKRF